MRKGRIPVRDVGGFIQAGGDANRRPFFVSAGRDCWASTAWGSVCRDCGQANSRGDTKAEIVFENPGANTGSGAGFEGHASTATRFGAVAAGYRRSPRRRRLFDCGDRSPGHRLRHGSPRTETRKPHGRAPISPQSSCFYARSMPQPMRCGIRVCAAPRREQTSDQNGTGVSLSKRPPAPSSSTQIAPSGPCSISRMRRPML